MKKNPEKAKLKESNLENVAGGYVTNDKFSSVPGMEWQVVDDANGAVKGVYSNKDEAVKMAGKKRVSANEIDPGTVGALQSSGYGKKRGGVGFNIGVSADNMDDLKDMFNK